MKKLAIFSLLLGINYTLKSATSDVGVKPDFFIAGVAKSGTTSLYMYLTKHPDILGAQQKEIHFFDRHFDKGNAWYMSQFPAKKESQLIGEATPTYFSKPKCLPRIFHFNPKAKIILLLRNPIQRAISAFFHSQRKGKIAGLSFNQVLDTKVRPWILEWGKYAKDLKRWLSVYPKEQILVVISEELFACPQRELNRIFRFLNLKEYPFKEYPKWNEGNNKEEIDHHTMDRLKKYFDPYNKELEKLLGRRLPW